MIKYIYYRIYKDWERKEKFHITGWWKIRKYSYPDYWCGNVFCLLFFPLMMLGGALMDCGNDTKLFMMGFLPIALLSLYLANRFEKRMRTYLPPEHYEKYDHIPTYLLSILLYILLILWDIVGTVLVCAVVYLFNLEGWLYNLLFL